MYNEGLIKHPQVTFGGATYIGEIYTEGEYKESSWAKLQAEQSFIDSQQWAIYLEDFKIGGTSAINTN